VAITQGLTGNPGMIGGISQTKVSCSSNTTKTYNDPRALSAHAAVFDLETHQITSNLNGKIVDVARGPMWLDGV
jgi:hypothetical protein